MNQTLVCIFVIGLSLSNGSTGTAVAENHYKGSIKPEIRITVPIKSTPVNSKAYLSAEIINNSEEKIGLVGLQYLMPPQFFEARGENEKDQKYLKNLSGKIITLYPGTSYSEVLIISEKSILRLLKKDIGFTDKIFQLLCFLKFSKGIYRGKVVVDYEIPGSGCKSVARDFEITLEPTLSVLLIGGYLGAFLFSIYASTYEFYSQSILNIKNFLNLIIRILVYWFIGSIAVTIALLIIYTNQDMGFPININVNDISGAILLGFFSHIISHWLYRKVTVQPTSSDDE